MTRKKSIDMNGPKLLIVESPGKIKTISKFLGKDFKVMSTVGHIKDLPERKLGITRADSGTIDLDYVVIKDKAAVISDICKQASKCSEIFLASDSDREGEIISWHIGQEIEKVFPDHSRIYRITYNEITKDALEEAIEQRKSVDINKVYAQQARRVLDRWVGYEVSPILWRKIAKGLSAGRVQSVALMLICDREQEIVTFVAEESWSISALFGDKKITPFKAELFKISNKAFKLNNKEEAEKVLAEIKKASFAISKITEKKRAKNPLPPFMTSTLQQDAYNKLGFSVDKTMSVAQRLYEGITLADKNSQEALITYMRTDSLRIADSALKSVRSYIKDNFGDKYLPKSATHYQKSGAQDAHEAIRVIDVKKTPDFVSRFAGKDEARLYELIWKRFVASQMEPAEYFQRQVLIADKKFTFKATGSTLIFDGFLAVYLVEDEESENVVKLPKELAEELPLDMDKPETKQHFTQPPPRYTEATLVKELEKRGIGRPSTYAAILSTIQRRGYADRDNKRFAPTELGKTVSEMLVKNLPDIINVEFTAKMEEDLDRVAQGEVKRDTLLNEFYGKFQKDLAEFGGSEQSRKSVQTELECPDCKKPLVIRFSKNGEFLGCSGFPECKFTSNFSRDESGKITLTDKEAAVAADVSCPQCGKTLVQKMSRFGPFLSCPGYPECKYIHQEALKMPCPTCGGNIVKRRWRGGSFWGCSGYPKCNFSLFGALEEKKCPECDSPYLLIVKDKETGELSYVCAKKCGYTKAVK